ncbi:NSS family neurotransmitter:Na+ symporter [Balneicella halophila]|uniref:NSS family neurotransmitter:Na+ symporter n=1 Tax=Balneicella halophila TaxID=1537566 RepID=A0A7L4USF6_BALHA|nr:sodium-dependent transporter [Balneicella halophila]PVX52361.1 NSS family neurotransmitter:Na+ symporter [Balneicella halophila]
MKNEREHFSSRFAVIAAVAGSAVGLGNIWKFPYVLGDNGGSAFILIYVLFVVALGIPLMMSEFVIGRRAQTNSFRAFSKLSPTFRWAFLGIIPSLAAFFILSYYTTIAGWTLEYLYQSITGAYRSHSANEIATNFESFHTSIIDPLLWQFCLLGVTAYIVYAGVKKGIEKYSKIMMPLMVILMIGMCIKALTLEGASEGLKFLFSPDFSKINPQVILEALGQAFFSLSLGMGILITYSSYMSKKEKIHKTVGVVVLADTLLAILAGVMIFPAVFSFNIDPSSGPGLVFVTLPNIFNQMSGGFIFAIIFFLLLTMAALTSTVSILEVNVSLVQEELKWTRKKATIAVTTAIAILGVFCTLSFGVGEKFHIFGLTFFDALDYLTSNWLLPIGGAFAIIFVGFILKKEDVKAELSNDHSFQIKWFGMYYFVVRFIAPLAIVLILLNQVGAFDLLTT